VHVKQILTAYSGACFVPGRVALKAPFWAWSEVKVEDDVNAEITNPQDEACKTAFCEAASPEFQKVAFSAENILARRVLHMFLYGMVSKGQRVEALRIIEDWRELIAAQSGV